MLLGSDMYTANTHHNPPCSVLWYFLGFEGVLAFVLLCFSGQNNNPRIIADVLWAHGRVPVPPDLKPGTSQY